MFELSLAVFLICAVHIFREYLQHALFVVALKSRYIYNNVQHCGAIEFRNSPFLKCEYKWCLHTYKHELYKSYMCKKTKYIWEYNQLRIRSWDAWDLLPAKIIYFEMEHNFCNVTYCPTTLMPIHWKYFFEFSKKHEKRVDSGAGSKNLMREFGASRILWNIYAKSWCLLCVSSLKFYSVQPEINHIFSVHRIFHVR